MAAPRIPSGRFGAGTPRVVAPGTVVAPPRAPAVVVAPPRTAPARPPAPRVEPARGAPPIPALAPSVPADPEPPILREPPAFSDSKLRADWIVSAIRAHEVLRSKSFYDTGHLIAELLATHRDVFRAKDIKELCTNADLGISHMTAQKYLSVARAFRREVALRIGIEKCYALVRYAKVTGRPDRAAAILDSDEPIRGARVRAVAATAKQIRDAVKAIQDATRAAGVPAETRAAADRGASIAQALIRKLGFRGAIARPHLAGGEARVTITISLDTALALEGIVPSAMARFGSQLARTRPESFAPLRAAGWKIRAAPS